MFDILNTKQNINKLFIDKNNIILISDYINNKTNYNDIDSKEKIYFYY